MREVVVLPQPDSPTRPSVSPARISKEMSSTALTWPRVLENRMPLVKAKCLRTFSTRSSGSVLMATERAANRWACRQRSSHACQNRIGQPGDEGRVPDQQANDHQLQADERPDADIHVPQRDLG